MSGSRERLYGKSLPLSFAVNLKTSLKKDTALKNKTNYSIANKMTAWCPKPTFLVPDSPKSGYTRGCWAPSPLCSYVTFPNTAASLSRKKVPKIIAQKQVWVLTHLRLELNLVPFPKPLKRIRVNIKLMSFCPTFLNHIRYHTGSWMSKCCFFSLCFVLLVHVLANLPKSKVLGDKLFQN